MSSNNENLAMQRIAKLVDENSFMEIGSLVTARSTDLNLDAAKAPSDGVITGHGLLDGGLQEGILLGPLGDAVHLLHRAVAAGCQKRCQQKQNCRQNIFLFQGTSSLS